MESKKEWISFIFLVDIYSQHSYHTSHNVAYSGGLIFRNIENLQNN